MRAVLRFWDLVTFLMPARKADGQEPPVPGGSDDPSRPHRCESSTRRKHGRLDGSGSEWRDRTAQPWVAPATRTSDGQMTMSRTTPAPPTLQAPSRTSGHAPGIRRASTTFVGLIAGATLVAGCAVPDVA